MCILDSDNTECLCTIAITDLIARQNWAWLSHYHSRNFDRPGGKTTNFDRPEVIRKAWNDDIIISYGMIVANERLSVIPCSSMLLIDYWINIADVTT